MSLAFSTTTNERTNERTGLSTLVQPAHAAAVGIELEGEAAATATELLRATTAGDDAVAEVDLFMGTDPSLPCNILAARLADEAARVSELLERC